MLRIHREHPDHGQYTQVDSASGRLGDITESDYLAALPKDCTESTKGIQAITGDEATIFTGETPATHTRFPRRIYFQITRNCNLACDYCFIKAGAGLAHVPVSAAMEMARFLARHGLIEVRLTGGEPTTHPHFFDILHQFRDEGVYVSVATNGLMSRRTLERIAEIDHLWVICSIDGDRDTHNRYRPGTFDKVVANLRYLKQSNSSIRIRLTTVLTRHNKGQMFELAGICKSLDAESITVIPLRPQVRSAGMVGDMVTAAEFKTVIEDLVAAKHRLGIQFTTTIETEHAGDVLPDPVFRKRWACAAGREGANLDYDAATGRFLVYGCAYSPAVDSTVPDKIRAPFLAGEFALDNPVGFLDIWRDDAAWTIFRDLSLKWDACHDCNWYLSHRCVGSCPIQNLDYSKINAEDNVLAQLRHRISRTSEWYCYRAIMSADRSNPVGSRGG